MKKNNEIMDEIEFSGAITYTTARARDEATKATRALAGLPASDYLEALHTLARFSTERTH